LLLVKRNIKYMKRSHRIFSALLLIVSLLFTQLAVAAYACPMMLRGAVESPAFAEQAASIVVMPCHEKSDASTVGADALCKAHCMDAQRTVGDVFAKLPIAFVAAFVVTIPPLVETPVSSPESAPGFSRALGPPLAITHCCLRI
jgi:hypothetical protein